jgi:Alpha/beta hydrolase domain
LLLATSAVALFVVGASDARAHVTRIIIEKKTSPAFNGQSFGDAGQYETLSGRAYGELDPKDPHNAIITDIQLAPRNGRGMVEYSTTFQIVKPVDISKASHLMWHDVPNRGGRLTIVPAERNFGDVGLSSGWQGDNSGRTVPGPDNDVATVPVAKNPDGSAITGKVMGRITNASGPQSQTIYVLGNPVPYKPASLDTKQATLVTHTSETLDGRISGEKQIPASDWAWAKCDAEHPFPGTPDPTQICVKGGFDPKLLYQVVYTAKDPYVLGIGFAAFRDVGTFFKYAKADDAGTSNPVGGGIQWTISRGVSQSGNFLRGFLHLGFNQDEAGRQVYDGVWPIIAGKRIALNFRFAQPDGVSMLYQPGSEGTQTWTPSADPIRGLPAAGILDRCDASHTCPKIIEHFGAAEFWGLKLSPSFVGATAEKDIPLPANVRRYYIASTQHGGGQGGFDVNPAAPPACPGNGYGQGALPANPLPHRETVNALRVHFRDWVMKGVEPPPSVYPTIAAGTLVEPTKQALGFPNVPGLPATAPTGFMNPPIDYDFGPDFNYQDGTGVITKLPPAIRHVMPVKAPKVDADGNELGGVPVVLREAPLGTYLGWNVVKAGFHQGQLCNYAGGMVPFAKTKAERLANEDPRLSLEERYGSHEGYVQTVKASAQKAMAAGFLLKQDADALIDQADKSNVLR